MDIIKILVEVLIFTSLIGVIFGLVANPDGNITGASLVLYGYDFKGDSFNHQINRAFCGSRVYYLSC